MDICEHEWAKKYIPHFRKLLQLWDKEDLSLFPRGPGFQAHFSQTTITGKTTKDITIYRDEDPHREVHIAYTNGMGGPGEASIYCYHLNEEQVRWLLLTAFRKIVEWNEAKAFEHKEAGGTARFAWSKVNLTMPEKG